MVGATTSQVLAPAPGRAVSPCPAIGSQLFFLRVLRCCSFVITVVGLRHFPRVTWRKATDRLEDSSVSRQLLGQRRGPQVLSIATPISTTRGLAPSVLVILHTQVVLRVDGAASPPLTRVRGVGTEKVAKTASVP